MMMNTSGFTSIQHANRLVFSSVLARPMPIGARMDEERRLVDGGSKNKSYNEDTRIKIDGDDKKPNELVTFNVSGRKFITTSHTLYNFPDSLIGTSENRAKLKRTKDGEIFLDRHAIVFESVLTFYQTGIFEPPSQVNQNIFVGDIKYYELVEEAMQSGLKGFDNKVIPMPERLVQRKIWTLLEYPDSSFMARIVSMFSLLVIITSIVTFCWETVPEYNTNKVNFDDLSPGKQLTIKILDDIELFCIVYFTFEIILRFVCSPKKWSFMKDILNIIDIVSILPFYVTLIFSMEGSVSIYFLRAVRLVRVFRVFKLSRHSNEMKILGIAVRESGRELGVLVFFILLAVLLFSSAVYYAEDGVPGTKLVSIPGAFWWSIVTMTTVGYGDEVPQSIPGRLVGAVCAMTGILVIAMPIPIIVNNFTRQYQRLKPASKYWEDFQDTRKLSGEGTDENGKTDRKTSHVIGLYEVDINKNEAKNTTVVSSNHSNHVNGSTTKNNGDVTEIGLPNGKVEIAHTAL
ncbi:potassium voltage-gated channel subfamily A member 1-like isoform X3 [Clytia hemisphaerica]|uniref:BTB domain-containing protein n=1 Tax=Clytia hemisphaerica TaxID=252671 RepID=A0A7M5XBH5_9CNID